LDICKEQGKDPVKSAKGSFNVRTKPAIHNLALRLSTLGGYRSLNQYVSAAIEEKNNRELAG